MLHSKAQEMHKGLICEFMAAVRKLFHLMLPVLAIRRTLGVNQASEILALLLLSSSLDLPERTTEGYSTFPPHSLTSRCLLLTFF